ncbi:MAG: hypothetical protein RQ731_06600 [Anaerosomatales bacterium]|nr:hypothetical protein [Anaerosomatales bacterium]MDT8434410.1 hypothetical protein [Anaerosomatales bacterium]
MLEPKRLDCWEYQGCGRGPGGRRSRNGQRCPAASCDALDGANGGTNAGRACWVVADTLCSGKPCGDYERKIHECRKCSFFARVHVEEGLGDEATQELLVRVRCT